MYLARPDSRLYGQELHGARIRMGELLAEQAPVAADMVMGVPDSGLPAAEGYARRSGIRYGQGLVKNRYIGRTFIVPDQAQRAQGVRRKLNPLRGAIAGQRLVVVDDSIVRGTTTRAMVRMLREAGAAEVHLRISSPPYRWPCYYGLDTGSRSELIAANLEVDEIREYLSADSLAYLSLDALKEATGAPGAGFCDACLTGHYPSEVPVPLGRSRRSVRRLADLRDRYPRDRDSGKVPPGGLTYAAAGVDIDAGERAVDAMRDLVASTATARACSAGSAASAACSRCPPATAARCWCRAPMASGPRWRWPWRPAASTPSGSTWSPCVSTTWSAAGPGRSSSSTTSCWAGSTPTRSAR